MVKVEIANVTFDELVNGIVTKLSEREKVSSFNSNKDLTKNENPHLTRKETSKFFKISLNCLNDWTKKGILKKYVVGQRVFYKKSELLEVMFNQKNS